MNRLEKQRLLIFDLLRIIAIALIVVYHISQLYLYEPLSGDHKVFGLLYLNPGILAVSLFLFVSGAVLEYSYGGVLRYKLMELLRFYYRRIKRVYPAYWISLVFGIIMAPLLLRSQTMDDLAWQFSGFNAYRLQWGGAINSIGWFIGLLAILYLAYPYLSYAMKKHPHATILALFIIEFGSRYLLNRYYPNVLYVDRWFPACSVFDFGLGIYLVRMSWYPKTTYNNRLLAYASELSFYIFLIHWPMIGVSGISIPFYLMGAVIIATMLMLLDQKIQQMIESGTAILNGYVDTLGQPSKTTL
jgi:peptidoglycan/LPS O-acetylase OafA/YrhL